MDQNPVTPATDEEQPVADGLRRAPSSRRALFGGVLGLGVGLPVLAACGSGEVSESGSSGDGEGATVPTGDVPSGSGVILEENELVVTQPADGEFKAFSATCTHRGCPVSQISEDGIGCTCHGSLFSLEDGSVLDGPAEEPLAERSVSVEGDNLTVT